MSAARPIGGRGALDRGWLRVLLATVSAVLVALCHPDPGFGILAWVALVPLLTAVHHSTGRAGALVGAWFGVVHAFGTYRWIFEIDAFNLTHALILSAYLSIYFSVWGAIAAVLSHRRAPAFIVGVSSAWIVVDYLRAHAGFLAAPWATLAHSQAEFPVALQIAAVTGEYGISGLIVLVNAALAVLLLRSPGSVRAAAFVVTVWTSALAYGALALRAPPADERLRVAVVQPAFTVAELHRIRKPHQRYARLQALSRAATAEPVDLLVWPESAIPDVGANRKIKDRLLRLARDLGAPLIVGSAAVEKFRAPDDPARIQTRVRNQAFLIDPEQPGVPPYDKQILVPFGEYVPLADFITWPRHLLPEPFHTQPGDSHRIFLLARRVPVTPFICWESLFADLFRPAVRAGARLVVQLTNDNWFGATGQPRQHNAASVLRAVEYRVATVIASNTGPSAVYDDRGRRVGPSTGLFESTWLHVAVPLGRGDSVYARYGDWLVALAAAALASLAALGSKRHTPRSG